MLPAHRLPADPLTQSYFDLKLIFIAVKHQLKESTEKSADEMVFNVLASSSLPDST